MTNILFFGFSEHFDRIFEAVGRLIISWAYSIFVSISLATTFLIPLGLLSLFIGPHSSWSVQAGIFVEGVGIFSGFIFLFLSAVHVFAITETVCILVAYSRRHPYTSRSAFTTWKDIESYQDWVPEMWLKDAKSCSPWRVYGWLLKKIGRLFIRPFKK